MSAESSGPQVQPSGGPRELLVDGVRVFHQTGPSKTRAVLFFGVGLQDESFETIGLTHLVEHLAMAQLPKTHLDANASVTVNHTAFYAHGRPDDVGAFLRRVCEALADLPLDHLAREKDVVAAEAGVGADLTTAAAWTARYGFAGAGLVATPGYGPLVHTEADVVSHLAAHFTAGRAALGVLGPLPEGLALPLPPGGLTTGPAPGTVSETAGAPAAVQAPRRFPRPRLGDGPEYVEGAPSPGVALLLDGFDPDDQAVRVAHTLLCERLEDLEREHQALVFSVVSETVDGPDGDVFTLAVDGPEEQAGDVARLVWEQLGDLAANGPTQAELDDVLQAYADQVDPTDDDVRESEPFRLAAETAIAVAAGRPGATPLARIAAGVAATTREDVRERLATAARRALLVLPGEASLPESAQRVAPIAERPWCPQAPELPPGRRLRPKLHRRLLGSCADRTLVLGVDSIAQQDEDGTVHAVRWDEVVGVVEVEGGPGVAVIGPDTCHVWVHPHSYGKAAHAEVLERLAPHAERMRRAVAGRR
ncbi:insulinase family protein [Quadrisphaera setariae]|uniref:Insulinase family protein n=1 Tax=Quadrisphaera setariae TaxID=2593304 RepID=A0A5C8ZE37_9ACTN|nr:insulinase family protein [Quadrisphaera setariae]TXR55463.1 insulinase family protein [Quadrisphaera setariae]